MSQMLTREQLLQNAKATIKRETLEIPELGGSVMVRGLTAREYTEVMQTWASAEADPAAFRDLWSKVSSWCLENAKGERLLQAGDDLGGLVEPAVMDQIRDAVLALSGFKPGDDEGKDSPPSDDSSTD